MGAEVQVSHSASIHPEGSDPYFHWAVLGAPALQEATWNTILADGRMPHYCWMRCNSGLPKLSPLPYRASQVALSVKNLPSSAGDLRDMGSIPGSGRSSGEGHGHPLQCPCLENPMDRGAWKVTAHRAAQSWTRLKQLSTHPHIACSPLELNRNVRLDDVHTKGLSDRGNAFRCTKRLPRWH